jgi:mono/diheme cytochrome c family protein
MSAAAFLLAAVAVAARAQARDARSLFLQHCASCHGETGDGKGTAQLDRPARSFKDGGFSHGNTSEAIFKTLTFGIPGTPMPAAPSVLTESERKSLADYVISLGPPPDPVAIAETDLVVGETPVFARGKLAAIAQGLPDRPRALLVGLPGGLSFEYRVDDPRLLGVRRGGFVERADWRGRGGDPLKPLGSLVWLAGSGDPAPTFSAAEDGVPLEARLTSTSTVSSTPVITYDLRPRGSPDPRAAPVAHVGESPSARNGGSGFTRTFSIESTIPLRLRVADPGPRAVAAGLDWTVRKRADGTFEAISVRGLHRGEILVPVAGAAEVTLALGTEKTREVSLSVLLAPAWDDAAQARWLAEAGR